MSNRPQLVPGLDPDEFLQYYYLKEELTDFCRELGLQTSGGKIEITERIARYLRTGEKLRARSKTISSSNRSASHTFDRPGFIMPDTVIEGNFRCSDQHRIFFKNIIGPRFKFNVEFQNWIKENVGKTYGEAITAYYEIQESKKNNRTVISRQFEYNTYIRDFYDDPVNKGKPIYAAIQCWKYKKSLPGTNKYEQKDLVCLNHI